jgi:hypothetical protein
MSWHPPYAVHPGVQMMVKWEQSLADRTGRSLDQWIELLAGHGPESTAERRAWLKREHGLGTNYCSHIVDRAEGRGEENSVPETYLDTAVRYVEDLYAGGKAGLRPLHDALIRLGLSVGDDVRICPCRTIVPLYRNHVFAEIKPRSRTRVDIGFALGDTKAEGRLQETGGFAKKDRITHNIPITRLDDIDGEVERWLKVAYERDA